MLFWVILLRLRLISNIWQKAYWYLLSRISYAYPEEADEFRLWISRMLHAVYGLVWPGLHLWLGQSQAWPGVTLRCSLITCSCSALTRLSYRPGPAEISRDPSLSWDPEIRCQVTALTNEWGSGDSGETESMRSSSLWELVITRSS